MPTRKKSGLPAATPTELDAAARRFGILEIVPLTVYHVAKPYGRRPGPWTGEADKIAWTDPATGMPCIIRRSGYGHLCGYVAVEADHPLYGFREDALPEGLGLTVHGRVSYAWPCERNHPVATSVWRQPPSPDAGPAWWLGFECNHSFDIVPGQPSPRDSTAPLSGLAIREVFGDASCGRRACACPPFPMIADSLSFGGGDGAPVYRDEAYVYRQCVNLAAQLDAIARGLPLPHVPSTPPTGLDPQRIGGGR